MVVEASLQNHVKAVGTPWHTWCWAIMVALGLNLAFFLLMPHLLFRTPVDTRFEAPIAQIQIVRIKRPELSLERETTPPPQQKRQRPQPSPVQEMIHQPRWPLEIDAKLPAAPTSLALPLFDAKLDLNDLFGIGDLDQPLVALARIPPVYPLAAKRKGTQGWVAVRFVVNAQGRVEQVTIVEAQPPGVFEESVKRCVSGWRFQPGTIQGRPVSVWAETTVRFELD